MKGASPSECGVRGEAVGARKKPGNVAAADWPAMRTRFRAVVAPGVDQEAAQGSAGSQPGSGGRRASSAAMRAASASFSSRAF